jgi:hypothetical protein
MPREEVAAVISLLDGTAQLVTELLYGSGLRIIEAVRRIGSGRATILRWCQNYRGTKL